MGKIISVISDTHGKLRPEVEKAIENSDMIFHLGDIGKSEILETLRNEYKVKVVKGNVDEKIENLRGIDKIKEFEYEGFRFLLIHNIAELDLKEYETPDIIIYGHSHMPYEKVKEGILYLNPGSVGPKRFTLPVSMLKLHIDGKKLKLEWIEI